MAYLSRYLVGSLFGCWWALALSCSSDLCYPTQYARITDYSVRPNVETPGGIPVDHSGVTEPVDLDEIDIMVLGVADCVEGLGFDDVDLGCLEIKVAPDWYLAHDGSTQIFPCDIDQSVCDAKVESGVLPDLPLKCACRAMIQGESIIVPPNLGLLRSELVRLFTGINYVWIPEFAECL